MSKKGTRALASATLMSLVLTTALSAGPVQAAAGQATRLGEADRYATAAKVATSNWDKAETVVLVNGEGYADAVSGSALAKKLGAPILLTAGNALTTETKDALTKLGAKNVYVVGGNASVSAALRTELKASYTVTELGGANRYETNAAVAEELVKLGVDPANVMMVGGEGFSDALSVAPIAAAKGQILLLGMNDANYMKPVVDFVKKHNSKVTVVGTKGVINDTIYSAVGATSRVEGGADRWDTNQKVLAAFKETVKFDKLYVASASYNAKDNGFADALVASALAGKYAAPLVLVDKDGSTGTNNALDYIKKNATKKTDLNVVGGTGVVSEAVLNAVTAAVGGTVVTPGDSTVQSIEAVNLNQFKVVYGTDVDSDSAEDVTNYKIDGTQLTTSGAITGTSTPDVNRAVAVLQDDNRTVLVTLAQAKDQYKDYTVSVKKAVITADKSRTIDAFDQTVNFSDTALPTLKSVTVQGNNKLTVEFSEPVDMQTISTTAFTNKFKINGQNISSFGLNTTTLADGRDLSEIKDKVSNGTNTWSSKVEFYFDTALPSGNNTLKVSDGDKSQNVLVDAAGFVFKEATMDFTVDTVADAPVVKEVKADADGTIWVRFDRPMDKKTALDKNYYVLNDAKSGSTEITLANTTEYPNAALALKEGDTAVKITGLSDKINTGSNTIFIKDDVKDAYGKAIEDDTRVNFTQAKDETKPTVLSATMVDSETIRVRFSKDINMNYAKQVSNYTLKDASNLDISSHIKEVKPSTGVMDNGDTWDIKMYKNPHEKTASNPDTTTDWRLTGSKYTLTIKNLADTTSNKNVMDEYTTTLTGTDDVAPKITSVYKKTGATKPTVVIYFSEAMDGDTLKAANFKYRNGSNDSKDMPSSATISVSSDSKAVTVEFPTNFGINDSTKDSDNNVTGIVAQNVKDEAGNVIDTFNNSMAVGSIGSASVALKDNCYRIQYDGDDILVKVQYDGAIDPDTLTKADFAVAGQNPDSISVIGSDLVLRFSKDTPAQGSVAFSSKAGYAYNPLATGTMKKVDVIKYAGANATFTTLASGIGTKDEAGIPVATGSSIAVYNNSLAPKTTSDYWYATTTSAIDLEDVAGTDSTTVAAVVLSFDTELYTNSGVRPDDFTFTAGGKEVKADKVKVVDNNLVFLFKIDTDTDKAALFANNSELSVALKNTSVDISSKVDLDGEYAKYVPSNDDKTKTRTIKVKSTSTLTLNDKF